MSDATLSALLDQMQKEAQKGEMSVDRAVYRDADRDPTRPILNGSGSVDSRLAIFGRDPGRFEVVHGEPFIGAGGQLIRGALHEARFQAPCPDIAASVDAGRDVFWCNTVPFKPLGNKAWSMKVKRRFAPAIARCLVEVWTGHDLLTFGNVAFHWFRILNPELRPTLDAFWEREDRYSASCPIHFMNKRIVLHPLPHPSPLNARWYKAFPGLLRARLNGLDWPPT